MFLSFLLLVGSLFDCNFFWFCFAFGHYSFVLVFSLVGYDESTMGCQSSLDVQVHLFDA